MPQSFQLSLTPSQLWQAINPWTFHLQGAQFGLINIDLGQTPRPDIERAVLDRVGSYGRQLGRIGDALEVLMRHVPLEGLTETEQSAIEEARIQLAQVRSAKRRLSAPDGAGSA